MANNAVALLRSLTNTGLAARLRDRTVRALGDIPPITEPGAGLGFGPPAIATPVAQPAIPVQPLPLVSAAQADAQLNRLQGQREATQASVAARLREEMGRTGIRVK